MNQIEIRIQTDGDKSEQLIPAFKQVMAEQTSDLVMMKKQFEAKEEAMEHEKSRPIVVKPPKIEAPKIDSQAIAKSISKELSSALSQQLAKIKMPAARPVTRTVVKEVTPDLGPITRVISKHLKQNKVSVPTDKTGTPFYRPTIEPSAG